MTIQSLIVFVQSGNRRSELKDQLNSVGRSKGNDMSRASAGLSKSLLLFIFFILTISCGRTVAISPNESGLCEDDAQCLNGYLCGEDGYCEPKPETASCQTPHLVMNPQIHLTPIPLAPLRRTVAQTDSVTSRRVSVLSASWMNIVRYPRPVWTTVAAAEVPIQVIQPTPAQPVIPIPLKAATLNQNHLSPVFHPQALRPVRPAQMASTMIVTARPTYSIPTAEQRFVQA